MNQSKKDKKGQLKRKEIDNQYKWAIEDIFANNDD